MASATRGLAAVGLTVASLAAMAAPARADSDFGVRYWSGFGDTGKSLYGVEGSPDSGALVSRLTYSGLKSTSAELFGRIGNGGVFLKGFVGVGQINSGNLQDEDFPPVISPYSSTNSAQRGGKLGYATGDVGYYFWGGANSRIGAFAGYNYLHQVVNAYGCTQEATNPVVCFPGEVDPSTLGITQTNNWNSARFGVTGDIRLGRVQIGGDAAIVRSSLSGTDAHWLRIGTDPGDFTGPVPEDGKGWGYQLEANATVQVTKRLTLGVGARYWHMESKGDTHFENHVVGGGGGPQGVDWQTTMYGLTGSATWQF
jgi:hypothetical protein